MMSRRNVLRGLAGFRFEEGLRGIDAVDFSDSDTDSSISDDFDIISKDLQEMLCAAKEAQVGCKVPDPCAKDTPEEKPGKAAEREKAQDAMAEQAIRLRGMLMAADNRWEEHSSTAGLKPSDITKRMQGLEISSRHIAERMGMVVNMHDHARDCPSSSTSEEEDDCFEESQQNLFAMDAAPKVSQVKVEQEIRLVHRSEMEDENYVSVSAAVTTVAGPDSTKAARKAYSPPCHLDEESQDKKSTESKDPCEIAVIEYIKEEKKSGSKVNFKLPLQKEVDEQVETCDTAGQNPPEDSCSMVKQLPEESSYPWPGGLRQILPFECTSQTPILPKASAAEAARRRRRRLAAQRRGRLCDLPEFCPPPSGPCSGEASASASQEDHPGFACPSYIGYSPYNMCIANWLYTKSNAGSTTGADNHEDQDGKEDEETKEEAVEDNCVDAHPQRGEQMNNKGRVCDRP